MVALVAEGPTLGISCDDLDGAMIGLFALPWTTERRAVDLGCETHADRRTHSCGKLVCFGRVATAEEIEARA
jgi:hypothetical protein